MIDSGACAYNILPTAGSSAGYKHSDETKEKISSSLKGNKNSKGQKLSEEAKAKVSASRINTGKLVYLYIVRTHGLELSATFHNRERASESLGIKRTTLYKYIKNRTLFKMNGVSHVVSWNADLS